MVQSELVSILLEVFPVRNDGRTYRAYGLSCNTIEYLEDKHEVRQRLYALKNSLPNDATIRRPINGELREPTGPNNTGMSFRYFWIESDEQFVPLADGLEVIQIIDSGAEIHVTKIDGVLNPAL